LIFHVSKLFFEIAAIAQREIVIGQF